MILFPKAWPTLVIGYIPGPSEEVSQEEDDALLNPPEEEKEAEPAPSVRTAPSNPPPAMLSTSGYVPLSNSTQLSP